MTLEPERWWIVIAKSGSVYPLTNADKAAQWEGKAARIIGPLAVLPVPDRDEMVERGAKAIAMLGLWDHLPGRERALYCREVASAALDAALGPATDQEREET